MGEFHASHTAGKLPSAALIRAAWALGQLWPDGKVVNLAPHGFGQSAVCGSRFANTLGLENQKEGSVQQQVN